eukprot:CAMPEP_0176370560 /NCGR_PEP_ID=MMETSP0126-20121128/24078_1 /TAXON_ID=141414 ORGANISM="Strombidinopsis acuminatum, Strain SPMC142" /NCGR_SAMPLE_ID=MMETSP0126 /ASSEMBLY_ACC=CAM_ASM_000229 /LENGTH=44 /DNA_ID= /DNA_START= /DNA_END= /DNA_ORIENTATION=
MNLKSKEMEHMKKKKKMLILISMRKGMTMMIMNPKMMKIKRVEG